MDVNLTARPSQRKCLGRAGDDGFRVRFEARSTRLADCDPCCQALDKVAGLLSGSPLIVCVDL